MNPASSGSVVKMPISSTTVVRATGISNSKGSVFLLNDLSPRYSGTLNPRRILMNRNVMRIPTGAATIVDMEIASPLVDRLSRRSWIPASGCGDIFNIATIRCVITWIVENMMNITILSPTVDQVFQMRGSI